MTVKQLEEGESGPVGPENGHHAGVAYHNSREVFSVASGSECGVSVTC